MSLELGSIIGFSSVVVAILGLWLETRRSRLAMHADMLLRLDERFCGAGLRQLRQCAAQNLIAGAAVNNELSELFDFFSNIAYMVKRGALDASMAYEGFQYWILGYWYGGQDYIAGIRRTDPESWLTLEYLVQRFNQIKQARHLPTGVSPASIASFMQEETRSRGAA